MVRFVTAREAVAQIKDGAVIGLAGMGLSGWAEELGCAIRDSYHETGHPRDLSLKQGSAMGDWKSRGTTRLGEAGEGCVTHWCGAHVGSAFALRDLAVANKLACHCLPQGVIVNLWREIAAGRPGLITKVGLGTFVDPRVEGGRMNESAKEELVRLVSWGGEEYLFYPAFKPDVALLRGTIADEHGNISFEHESIINEGLAVAEAVHNNGGIVIVQVEYITRTGSLRPKDIKIPGILVDYVVQATNQEACWQAEGVYYEPAFSGQIQKPLKSITPLELNERKVVARRCAMELRSGDVVNLGVGMAADVANVVSEEGYSDRIVMTTESGQIGGVPSALPNFGSAYNPEATIEHGTMFDLINGGGLNVTCLGLGEADEEGNINVSKFGPRLTGPGGFIDITQATTKVVFCGTFVGKAAEKVGNGKLVIEREGTIRKFLKRVEQITFSGRYVKPEQEVLYVTERCVMRLVNGKMMITEIAPGVNLERDILSMMDFTPMISPDLRLMDERLFCEKWGALDETILLAR